MKTNLNSIPPSSGGIYNSHPIGVWFDAAQSNWAIFNQDGSLIPHGTSFNVWVVKQPAARHTSLSRSWEREATALKCRSKAYTVQTTLSSSLLLFDHRFPNAHFTAFSISIARPSSKAAVKAASPRVARASATCLSYFSCTSGGLGESIASRKEEAAPDNWAASTARCIRLAREAYDSRE